MQARSDGYALTDARSRKRGWSFACEYVVRSKLRKPLTLAEIQSVPGLHDWGALRRNFQGSAFAIPDDHWVRLVRLIEKKNRGAAEAFRAAESDKVPRRVLLEEDIENHLAADLSGFATPGGGRPMSALPARVLENLRALGADVDRLPEIPQELWAPNDMMQSDH